MLHFFPQRLLSDKILALLTLVIMRIPGSYIFIFIFKIAALDEPLVP